MQENIFENYTTLLKEEKTQTDNKYDLLYFKKFYLPKLSKDKNISILDIGCGNGKYLKILKDLGYNNTYGIDISPEQITQAQKSGFNNVKCTDTFEFLKNNENKYDTIFLIDVLEHVKVKYSFELINLIYKSLKQKGMLLIQVPNAFALFSPHRYSDITHLRAYSTLSLRQTLNLSEFEDITFTELPPFIHGIKSFIRTVLWKCFIKPIIKSFMLIAYGKAFDSIYTSNFLCSIKK